MPSDMGDLPQIGPDEEAIEAVEIIPPPAHNQVQLNSPEQIDEENSKHEDDEMENGD